MPEKRRKSKNWRMSKKNAKIKAMRMKVPAAKDTPIQYKNHKARAVVIQSHLLKSAKGLSSYIAQTSSQRGVAGGRYTPSHSILTIGDGDFSFSVSLASALGGANIVATSYDSKRELLEKYPDALDNLGALAKLGASVHHSIDASSLASCLSRAKELRSQFDRIVFNFPHAESQDVERQQRLLFGFFKDCRENSLLTTRGQVHVTLRTSAFYDSWDIETVAASAGLSLAKKFPFKASDFYGYREVRTRGANVMRQAPSIEGAVTYAFIAPQSVTQRDKEVDTISKSDSETTATSESPSDVQAKRKAPQQSKEVQHQQVPAKKTKKQRKKAQQALPVFRAGAKASLDGTRNEESSTDAGADDNVDFFAEWVKATGGDPSKLRKTEVRAKDADEDQSSDDSSSIDDDSDDDDLLAELILARRNRRL